MPPRRQIKNIEELYQLSLKGARVYAPNVPHLEQSRKAEQILGMSARAVLKTIEKGLYLEGQDEEEETLDTAIQIPEPQNFELKYNHLKIAQQKILATGLSQSQIGARLGITQQAVHNFITAKSVQTRVLEKYLRALNLE